MSVWVVYFVRTRRVNLGSRLQTPNSAWTFPFKPNAPWTTHQRRKKKIRIGNFSLDGSSHQTGDTAFTPAMPHDLHHKRSNTDSHNSHNTQYTKVKQNKLCFMQKDTQPSQTCSGGHITTNLTHIDAGDASLLMRSIN